MEFPEITDDEMFEYLRNVEEETESSLTEREDLAGPTEAIVASSIQVSNEWENQKIKQNRYVLNNKIF